MSYVESWLALASRIAGIKEAVTLVPTLGFPDNDSYGAGRYLMEQCGATVKALEVFRNNFASTLPSEAVTALDRFLNTSIAKAVHGNDPFDQRGQFGIALALGALGAEITFILSDRQEQLRLRSERAFLLLDRMLAVDGDVRKKWDAAFNTNEIACEKLGSLHLLSQGIFAFKIDSSGARTDLIFPEPINDAIFARSVDGLVLTEWKLARNEKDVAKKFSEALRQAELYKSGALAGTELTTHRYLIVVSETVSPAGPPPDTTVGGATYRHINLVLNRSSPSKAARLK